MLFFIELSGHPSILLRFGQPMQSEIGPSHVEIGVNIVNRIERNHESLVQPGK